MDEPSHAIIAALDDGLPPCPGCRKVRQLHPCHPCGIRLCCYCWCRHRCAGEPPKPRPPALWEWLEQIGRLDADTAGRIRERSAEPERTADVLDWQCGLQIDFIGVCPEPGGPMAWGYCWTDRGTGEYGADGGYRAARADASGLLACLFGLGCGLKAALDRVPPAKPGVLFQTDNAACVELLMNGFGSDVPEPLRAAWGRIGKMLAGYGPEVVAQYIDGAQNVMAVRQAGEWWDRGQQQRTGEAA